MPVRGKKLMRRIVMIEASAEKTQRGFPRTFTYTLECGHRDYEHYCPRVFVQSTFLGLLIGEKGFLQAMREFPLKKHCYDCARGKEPSPKCSKIDLPLGVMAIGYCRENCGEEQRMKCNKTLIEWDKKDKPWLYGDETRREKWRKRAKLAE